VYSTNIFPQLPSIKDEVNALRHRPCMLDTHLDLSFENAFFLVVPVWDVVNHTESTESTMLHRIPVETINGAFITACT
jgi:hypothetical protein